MTKQHERVVEFGAGIVRPVEFSSYQPGGARHTFAHGGRNLVEGGRNFIEDWQHLLAGQKRAGTEQFQVGRNLAVSGKVVYRNRLIELIQYAPQTGEVRPGSRC